MNDTTITPRDGQETAVVGAGKRIAAAISIVGAAVPALLAAFGGVEWITDHLPLLGVGLGSLVSGGVASYIAVRRMRVDRAAKASLVLIALALAVSGCVAIRATSDGEKAGVLAFGTGADSAAALANVAVNGAPTEGGESAGVSFDSGSSRQQSLQALQGLIALGALLGPHLPQAAAVSGAASVCQQPAAVSAPVLDAEGFRASPGPAGEGVYGRPECGLCQSYRAAHQNAELINVNVDASNAAMWKALRDRGFTGSTFRLPVVVTADGYTTNAK